MNKSTIEGRMDLNTSSEINVHHDEISYQGKTLTEAILSSDFPLSVLLWGMLLGQGHDPFFSHREGLTPFHFAASVGSVEILHFLYQQSLGSSDVDRDPMIDRPSLKGITPLMVAAACGHVSTLHFLISHGSSLNQLDKEGYNAIHYAARYGSCWGLHYLFTCPAFQSLIRDDDPGPGSGFLLDARGKTLVYHALASGNRSVLQYLLSGPKLRLSRLSEQHIFQLVQLMVDREGQTMVHYAVERGNPKLLRGLRGALEPQVLATLCATKDATGSTPIDLARRSQRKNLIDAVSKSGSDELLAFSAPPRKRSRVLPLVLPMVLVLGAVSLTLVIPWYVYFPSIVMITIIGVRKYKGGHHHHHHHHHGHHTMTKSLLDFPFDHKPASTQCVFPKAKNNETPAGFWLGWFVTFVLASLALVWTPRLNDFVQHHVEQLVLCWSSSLVLLLLWTRLCLFKADPGQIQTSVDQMREYFTAAENGLDFGAGRDCVTCVVKRPSRSKHDAHAGICVTRFDHHCVWINNAVGARNHVLFLMFVVVQLLTVAQYLVLGVQVFVHQTSHLNRGEKYTQVLHELFPLTVLSIWASLSILFLTHLLAKQLYNIAHNVTENEVINWKRYDSMKIENAQGQVVFHNHYDRGWKFNISEFLGHRKSDIQLLDPPEPYTSL